MILLDISSQPVWGGFAPLFWAFDRKRPKTEVPTRTNFKTCYERRTKEGSKPGPLEKRLLIELFGSLGVIGGGALYAWGKLRDKKWTRRIGATLGLASIGAAITGVIKFFNLDLNKFLQSNVPSKKNTDTEKKQDTVTRTLSLFIAEARQNDADLDAKMKADPTFKQQFTNISNGLILFLRDKLSENEILHSPAVKNTLKAAGYGWIYSGIEVMNIYEQFIRGELEFESTDGRKYSTLNQDEKIKENCTLLEISIDDSKDQKKLDKAYRKKAIQHHPDSVQDIEKKQEAAKQFCRIAEAYEFLSKLNEENKATQHAS